MGQIYFTSKRRDTNHCSSFERGSGGAGQVHLFGNPTRVHQDSVGPYTVEYKIIDNDSL